MLKHLSQPVHRPERREAPPLRTAETVLVPPGPEPARPKSGPNLLINASFESGQAYFYDDTRERAVPMGWALTFHDANTQALPRQAAPFGRPITALINSHSVAAADRGRVFAGGVFCWKLAGGSSPVWVRLTQTVAGLEPGRRYRFSVNLLPDVIARTHPQIAYAADPLSVEALQTATFGEQAFASGWKTGGDMPPGRYTRLALDFTAPGPRGEVALEIRGRWALPLGAWYIDELSLAPV
jgi:hypothetical protein